MPPERMKQSLYSQFLFAISLQTVDVRDFDVRWDHASLSVSEMLSEVILEGLYKSKLENSVQFQIVLALYDQETAQSKEPNNQQLKTNVKFHIGQMMRTRSFRVQNDVVERRSVTKVQKKRKLTLRGKWKSVFSGRHMDRVPEETHVVSVMIQESLETVAKVRDKKRTIVFSCIPFEGKTD